LITQSWRITADNWPQDGRLRLVALVGLLLAVGQPLLGDPNVNSAVQSLLQPKFIPYYVIAIGIVTELARRRTAGKI
jgi:hypothetical protein